MPEADEINLALTIVTFIMAVATGLMVLFTYRLADVAAEGNRQADKHHRQNLRPFCVVEFAGASDPSERFGADFDPTSRWIKRDMGVISTAPSGNGICICGAIKNKGTGLAKDVVVYLNGRRGDGESGAYRLTRPVVVSGLITAAESIDIDVTITARDVMKIWNGNEWKDTFGFELIPDETYEVVLEYKDVFDNVFRTVHPKGIWHNPVSDAASIGTKAKQREMMVRPNKPMPIFLADAQAVRTLVDIS